ncbi:hypothetical protein U1Q18_044586, partial [Sarracenia purpurea var. burkii]
MPSLTASTYTTKAPTFNDFLPHRHHTIINPPSPPFLSRQTLWRDPNRSSPRHLTPIVSVIPTTKTTAAPSRVFTSAFFYTVDHLRPSIIHLLR